MGTIKKIGDTYYIEFYARGLMYSQVAGPDLAAAEALLQKTEATIAGGEALTIVRHIDIPVFFEQFLYHAEEQFGPKSSMRFARLTRHFTAFIAKEYPEVKTLAQVTPSVCEAYKAALVPVVKPALFNFSILLLREVMEYGIKLGFLNDNPTLHVRLLPVPAKHRPATARYALAASLLGKGVGVGKACQLLRLGDIARIVYYVNLVPLSHGDMYNEPR